jgi:hypothetical protein
VLVQRKKETFTKRHLFFASDNGHFSRKLTGHFLIDRFSILSPCHAKAPQGKSFPSIQERPIPLLAKLECNVFVCGRDGMVRPSPAAP